MSRNEFNFSNRTWSGWIFSLNIIECRQIDFMDEVAFINYVTLGFFSKKLRTEIFNDESWFIIFVWYHKSKIKLPQSRFNIGFKQFKVIYQKTLRGKWKFLDF